MVTTKVLPTLILSNRHSDSSNLLWQTAIKLNWEILRITSPGWIIEERPKTPVIFGEPMFNKYIAEQLGLTILEPSVDFLTKLPYKWVKRKINLKTVHEARKMDLPSFIKPPNDKTFPAKIYQVGADLPDHLEDTETVLVSDPVKFIYEARFFILNRKIITWSPYLIRGKLSFNKGWNRYINKEVKRIVFEVISERSGIELPQAIVIDAGWLVSKGEPGIIESNEVCGSGFYGCNPRKVLQVLEKGAVTTHV